MSAIVKLATALPGDFETNGLDQHVGRLLDEPDRIMVAVVWIDTKSVRIDTDSGDHIPTVRVRRIEPLGDADQVSTAIRDLVQDAVRKRTGRTPIPFELGEIVEGHDPEQMTIDDE